MDLIIKLKSRIVSLNVSKKLKDAGYKQEGLWWWSNAHLEHNSDSNDWEIRDIFNLVNEMPFCDDMNKKSYYYKCWKKNIRTYSAPTIAELGEQLPNDEIIRYIEEMGGLSKGRSVKTAQWGDKCLAYIIMDLLKSPNDMAKMWLYLKEKRKD